MEIQQIQQIVRELKPLVMSWLYADWGDGWRSIPHAAGYGSTTTIVFAGVDCANLFPAGAPVRWRQREGWLYGYVISAVYGTDTTLTILGNSVVNAAIGSVWVSHGINPAGFPGWFTYSPIWTGFSSAPPINNAIFCIIGRLMPVIVNCAGNGTSNLTTLTVTLPLTPAHVLRGIAGYAVNNGVALTGACRLYASSSNVLYAYTNMATGAWNNSGDKRIDFSIIVEI